MPDPPDPPAGLDSLDEAADELYAAPPEGFVARRGELAAAARRTGRRDLAEAIAGLRRPTQGAWLVNLLVRRERAAVEDLLGLGAALQEAQQHLSGEALRELSAQRNGVVAALVARAGALGRAAGARPGSAALDEVQATLQAALARPEVAAEVRTGRLVRGASYAGFGVPDQPDRPDRQTKSAPGLAAVPAERSRQEQAERARREAAEQARKKVERQRVEREQAERERAVRAAEQALADAEREHDRQADLVREREGEEADLDGRLRVLQEQVRDVERRRAAARLEVRAAEARRSAAEGLLADAQQALDRARQLLADPGSSAP